MTAMDSLCVFALFKVKGSNQWLVNHCTKAKEGNLKANEEWGFNLFLNFVMNQSFGMRKS